MNKPNLTAETLRQEFVNFFNAAAHIPSMEAVEAGSFSNMYAMFHSSNNILYSMFLTLMTKYEQSEVVKLDLSNIKMTKLGLVCIFGALSFNSKIKELSLSKCQLDDTLIKGLSELVVKNDSLQHLDLSANDFTSRGLCNIEIIFKNNTNLTSLDLSGYTWEENDLFILAATLKEHKLLKQLTLTPYTLGVDARNYNDKQAQDERDNCLKSINDIEETLESNKPNQPSKLHTLQTKLKSCELKEVDIAQIISINEITTDTKNLFKELNSLMQISQKLAKNPPSTMEDLHKQTKDLYHKFEKAAKLPGFKALPNDRKNIFYTKIEFLCDIVNRSNVNLSIDKLLPGLLKMLDIPTTPSKKEDDAYNSNSNNNKNKQSKNPSSFTANLSEYERGSSQESENSSEEENTEGSWWNYFFG